MDLAASAGRAPGAGFRAVAVDLRGYGDSDKPPRGYDLVTSAADAAGLVRSLGEANAIVVGHGLGGLIGWTLAAYSPKAIRRLAVISMGHPLRMRASVLGDPLGQGRRSGYTIGPSCRSGPSASCSATAPSSRPAAGEVVRPRLARPADRADLRPGHEHPLRGALLA